MLNALAELNKMSKYFNASSFRKTKSRSEVQIPVSTPEEKSQKCGQLNKNIWKENDRIISHFCSTK